MKANGFILYRGPSFIGEGRIVVIATLHSANTKTGDMIQVWYLPEDADPYEALYAGTNERICGKCALQGHYDGKQMVNRVCYVNLGHAPLAIYEAYQNGSYPDYDPKQHSHLIRGREVRIGAYGDPAAGPTYLVRYLAKLSDGWTGYSHQMFWIDQRRANALARYLMCSCHTKAQHAEALRRGWRAFTTIAEGQKPPEGTVECPYYSRGIQCIQCQLCCGTSIGAKSVYIIAHNKTGLNLPKVQQLTQC